MKITAAALQMACSWNLDKNIVKAEKLVRAAANAGANIILLQELFETPYFCQAEKYEYLKLAKPLSENRAVNYFKTIAKELNVVLPISFFERHNNSAFNSVAVIDADGQILGVYRKTHIPDGHCYEEKFYFTPGDTGFKVWRTKFAKIGVGICWDQWFCESARIMAIMGAELLFYPTAIGSEPVLKADTRRHWQRVMQGHSAGNLTPVIASNRVGTQKEKKLCAVIAKNRSLKYADSQMTFYGNSFITDETGEILKQLDDKEETFITAEFDLEKIKDFRQSWGIFRDRRPEMYKKILEY